MVRGLWTFQLKPSLAAANATRSDDQGCFLHRSLRRRISLLSSEIVG
jgi:hypothetical protein